MSSDSTQEFAYEAPYAVFPDCLGETEESKVSGARERVAIGAGVLVGLVFLYFAYRVNDETPLLSLVGSFFPVTIDWIWSWVVGLGLLLSIGATAYAYDARRKGVASYYLLAVAGLVISVLLTAILVLDFVNLATYFVGSDGDLLWPDGKPVYFFPLSVLGVTLSMSTLVLVRGGDRYDRIASVVLCLVPLISASIPYVMGFEASEILRWTPFMFTVGGIAMMFSGVRIHRSLSMANLEAVGYASSRVYIVTLFLLGLVGFFVMDADEAIRSSADPFWIPLLLVNAGMSVAMLAAAVNSKRQDCGVLAALVLSVLALEVSVVLLFMVLLDMPDAIDMSRNIYLFPVSMMGVSLVMISVNLTTSGTDRDKAVGILSAVAPTVILAMVVALHVLDGADAGTAPGILAGPALYGIYLGFTALVFLSGLKIETFGEAQWPVLREKLRLILSRSREVLRDVVRNPMGLIGTLILIFFTVIAIFGPYLAPYEVDATRMGLFEPLQKPSPDHWMGTDVFGHDILSSLLYGARTSIIVGMFAAVIASVIGAAVGLYSGYAGGWKDEVLMRINDVMLSIPWLVLMILIAGLIGEISLMVIILIIGLTGWSATARLVRAQVLSLRERQYIERARAIGSGDMHIIKTHILPNSFPLVFANTILTVAVSILSEATLSFLHMRPYGSVTWGTMLSYAYDNSAFQYGLHYWIVMPGLCIVFLVLGFTLLGYAMDEVLNPRLRKR